MPVAAASHGVVPSHAAAPAASAVVSATPSQPAAPARQRATVVVKAPLDLTIKVNGQAIQRNKAEQTFTSPDLDTGSTYAYEFTAEAVHDGKPFTRTQRIQVRAGEQREVDFGRALTATARVTVHLPEEAKLYVDGVACPLTSSVRSFATPPLEKDQTYAYTLRATLSREGRTLEETQRITLQAGKEVKVDFNELTVKTTVRR